MKMFIALVVVSCFVVASAESPSERAYRHRMERYQYTVQSKRKFAEALYFQLAKERTGNIFISPQSVHLLLTSLTMGAGGTTQSQLEDVLEFRGTREEVRKAYVALLNGTKSNHGAVLTSNFIILNGQTLITSEQFRDTVSSLHTESTNIDFLTPIMSARDINSWVARLTHHKILKVLDGNSLSHGKKIVLVSAQSLTASWKIPFFEEYTRIAEFRLTKEITTNAELMVVEDEFEVADFVDAKFIRLPYTEKSNLIFVVIVPDKVEGLSAVEASLAKEHLLYTALNIRGFVGKYRIFLPKFKIEKRYRLKETLQNIGLKNIFESNANFSGITTDPLPVYELFHKTVLRVTEDGTEHGPPPGIHIKEPPKDLDSRDIRVNHPFMFAILCQESGAVLFLGRYTGPE